MQRILTSCVDYVAAARFQNDCLICQQVYLIGMILAVPGLFLLKICGKFVQWFVHSGRSHHSKRQYGVSFDNMYFSLYLSRVVSQDLPLGMEQDVWEI